MIIHLDTETFSATDLKAGVYRYVEDPRFLVLMLGWAVDDGPVGIATTPEQIGARLKLLLRADALVAHNAGFDRIVLSTLDRRLGDPARWIDTAALAAEAGYPQKLADAAKLLGAEEKDTAGTRLINLFSKPQRDGSRVLPEDKPEQWAEFGDYLRQDVRTLRDVHSRLPALHEREQALWVADQRINDRGLLVDVQMAQRAYQDGLTNRNKMLAEIKSITGVDNPNSVKQLGTWLGVDSLAKEAVAEELTTATGDRRKVLLLRQELALSSWNKYKAALDAVCADGRLRGQFRFCGAHTGRWSGSGVQPHNLPRIKLSETQIAASRLDLELGLGLDAVRLKAMIRSMFIGPFVVADYNAIEARVLAWLAGEQWVLDAFKLGRDIYTETANRMSTPGHQLDRSQGKVAVLALGYQGSLGSLRVMGADGTDNELLSLVSQWRQANPHIVGLWAKMERAFRSGGRAGEHITVRVVGRSRHIVLPSGRHLVYHNVIPGERIRFRSPRYGWQETYGGRLIENVTQAVARDILADTLLKQPDVVGHVHDEVLVEGEHSVRELEKLMSTPPDWAADLPLAAAAFTTQRYRKE